jgi:predicted nucleic acid-binding protein
LLWKPSPRRFAAFHTAIVPRLAWIALTDDDWKEAAQFWADSKRNGKQLSDIDVLLATLAHRIDAIIVSNDTDFDALPVKREDWRA